MSTGSEPNLNSNAMSSEPWTADLAPGMIVEIPSTGEDDRVGGVYALASPVNLFLPWWRVRDHVTLAADFVQELAALSISWRVKVTVADPCRAELMLGQAIYMSDELSSAALQSEGGWVRLSLIWADGDCMCPYDIKLIQLG